MSRFDLFKGDCVEQLKRLEDNSIDSVVCDPPYELGFMGKKWDNTGIAYSIKMWKEVLRVVKPGGHLLAFGGTRTYHRMACAIEDAGFEIRDCLQWLYGSGFPKSYNIGKGVDKLQVNQREQFERTDGVGSDSGEGRYNLNNGKSNMKTIYLDSKGYSVWEGWGSALKPANEPIVLARKPLSEKSIVENCLKWGVGGLNIDESKIGTGQIFTRGGKKGGVAYGDWANKINAFHQGRFPANIILDETAAKILDEQSGILKKGGFQNGSVMNTKGSGGEKSGNIYGVYSGQNKLPNKNLYGDDYGVSRFFYCAKASKKERNEGLENIQRNLHPTVKPVKLMVYLVRLVTPKGGVVLDPFMGSGTTGIACRNLGFGFIGIEKEREYFEISKARILKEGGLNGH